METLLQLSLGFTLLMLALFFNSGTNSEKAPKAPKKQSEPAQPPRPRPVVNAKLRTIAAACEAKLPEEDRGKVKLFAYREDTEHIAVLQIGDLNISLRRNRQNRSLFTISSFMEALLLAKDGYDGTGQYIPVPREVEFILSQKRIINVYLEALGLEQISEKDDFWCVDTATGWSTGWKRFNWDVAEAFSRLHDKSGIRTSDGNFISQTEYEKNAKLLLLFKGWEHLFVEI